MCEVGKDKDYMPRKHLSVRSLNGQNIVYLILKLRLLYFCLRLFLITSTVRIVTELFVTG